MIIIVIVVVIVISSIIITVVVVVVVVIVIVKVPFWAESRLGWLGTDWPHLTACIIRMTARQHLNSSHCQQCESSTAASLSEQHC